MITTPTVATDSMLRYLALGDSYTIGQSVAAEDRFPAQTVALLKPNIKISTPQYIATTGWTTTNLMDAINAQNLQPNYDIVTLLIGVNDQYQGKDTAGYRVRFADLLTRAIALAGNRISRVFVISIPDYSVTPFVPDAQKPRVRKEVDEFNAINKQETLRRNVAYVDITPGSRQGATNPALIAGDGLHPSALEYRKWADLLTPLIQQALR